MEELRNKPANKPTLAPASSIRPHHLPSAQNARVPHGVPGIFCNFYAALAAALANCGGLAVTPLHGFYLALAQSRIASKKRSHSLSCSSSIHSFGECAWAISPGPQMMLCTPARWNWPASVP